MIDYNVCCNTCQNSAIKQVSVVTPPKLLCIQLKRFCTFTISAEGDVLRGSLCLHVQSGLFIPGGVCVSGGVKVLYDNRESIVIVGETIVASDGVFVATRMKTCGRYCVAVPAGIYLPGALIKAILDAVQYFFAHKKVDPIIVPDTRSLRVQKSRVTLRDGSQQAKLINSQNAFSLATDPHSAEMTIPYRVYAVGVHEGSSLNNGHCKAFYVVILLLTDLSSSMT